MTGRTFPPVDDLQLVLDGHEPKSDEQRELATVVTALRSAYGEGTPTPSAELAALLDRAATDPARPVAGPVARPPRSRVVPLRARVVGAVTGAGVAAQLAIASAAAATATVVAGVAGVLPSQLQEGFDEMVSVIVPGASATETEIERGDVPTTEPQPTQDGPEPVVGGDRFDGATNPVDEVDDSAADKKDAERDAAEDKEDDDRDAAEDKRDAERDAAEDQKDAERDAAEDVKDDARDAAEDAKDDARDAQEDKQDAVAGAEDDKQDAAEEAQDEAEDANGDARDRGEDRGERTDKDEAERDREGDR
ncbi:hypothetical protein ACFP3Q_09790 [Nocardioides sp. GCM10027113]|uniref:hypothetical protein n=1 Tax=unclassified Nocardioides TaxID=2615069 RepID=UPI0036101BAE